MNILRSGPSGQNHRSLFAKRGKVNLTNRHKSNKISSDQRAEAIITVSVLQVTNQIEKDLEDLDRERFFAVGD